MIIEEFDVALHEVSFIISYNTISPAFADFVFISINKEVISMAFIII